MEETYTEIKCVCGCGMILRIRIDDHTSIEEIIKKNSWYVINKDAGFYCCPNCDVSIIK